MNAAHCWKGVELFLPCVLFPYGGTLIRVTLMAACRSLAVLGRVRSL